LWKILALMGPILEHNYGWAAIPTDSFKSTEKCFP